MGLYNYDLFSSRVARVVYNVTVINMILFSFHVACVVCRGTSDSLHYCMIQIHLKLLSLKPYAAKYDIHNPASAYPDQIVSDEDLYCPLTF